MSYQTFSDIGMKFAHPALKTSRLSYADTDYRSSLDKIGSNNSKVIGTSQSEQAGTDYRCPDSLAQGDETRFQEYSTNDVDQRVRPTPGGCHDALMELARENLILHEDLYLANMEVPFHSDISMFSTPVHKFHFP